MDQDTVHDISPTFTALGTGAMLAGRFEIDTQLSMGGFSLVYRALDHETNRYIVIKECAPMGLVTRDEAGVITPNTPQAAALMARIGGNFRIEADTLSKLTRAGVENISSYVADFEENGTHYIAMDEAVGMDLHGWAMRFREAGVPFPADALEEILTGLLDILGSVHAQGIYHCDVKPANIVIDGEGNITLIDFGAVRSTGQQHDENVQVSPGFSPPEFYPGHRELIGPWTDIYMLAALFYEIISGRAPEPANERAVRDRTPRLANDPKLHKIYPTPLLISIDKALSLDPADRFATAKLWEDAYMSMQSGPQLLRATAPRARKKKAFAQGQISLQSLQAHQRGKSAGKPGAKPAKPAGPLLSTAQIAGKPGAGRAAAAVAKPLAAAKPAAPAVKAAPAKPVAAKPAPAKPVPAKPAAAKPAPAKPAAPKPAAAPAKPAVKPVPAKISPAAKAPTRPLPASARLNSDKGDTMPYILAIVLLLLGIGIICYFCFGQ